MGGGRYGTRRSSSFLVHYLPAGSRHCLRSLGRWPLTNRPSGLDAVQGALRPLYLAWIRGGRRPQPCVLAVRPDGLSVRYDEGGGKETDNAFHPFRTIAMWAAVRCQVRVNPKAGGLEWAFVPLDTSLPSMVARRCYVPLPDDDLCRHLAVADHPPLFLCVMRQRGVAHSLACHVFACVRTEQAAALATGLYHALTASMKPPNAANQSTVNDSFHHTSTTSPAKPRNILQTTTSTASSTKSKRASYCSSKTSTLSAEISFKHYFPFSNLSWKSSNNEPKSSKWSNYLSFLPSFKSKNVQRSRSFSQLLLEACKSKKVSTSPSRSNLQHRTAPISRNISARINEEETPVQGPGVFFRTPLPRSASFLQLQARNKDLLSDASLEVRVTGSGNTTALFHKPDISEYSDCTSGCFSLACPYEIGDFLLAQKGCSMYSSLKNEPCNSFCECCNSDTESHDYAEIDYSTTIASKQENSITHNTEDKLRLLQNEMPLKTLNRPNYIHDSVLEDQSECSSTSGKCDSRQMSEDSDSANDADVESLAEKEDKKLAVDEPLQLLATANIEDGHVTYSGNSMTIDISGLKKSAELSAIFQQLGFENDEMPEKGPEVILNPSCMQSSKPKKRKRKDEAITTNGSQVEKNVWQMEGAIYYP